MIGLAHSLHNQHQGLPPHSRQYRFGFSLMAAFIRRVFAIYGATSFIVAFGVIGAALTILFSLQPTNTPVIPDN